MGAPGMTGATTETTPGGAAAVRRLGAPQWMHGPIADVALALVWIPFAVVAHVLQGQAGDRLPAFVAAVFLLSFSHQPLTLALVYGDPEQLRLRRAIFTWSPLVFVVAVFAGLNISMVALAVVGGLWNAEHTLMQRYGIVRIYGRKAGQGDGRLERAMLFSWLALALVWVGADTATPDRIRQVDLGENNTLAVEQLASLRGVASVLVPIALAVALGLGVAFVVQEWRHRRQANPAKWVYVASTAALFGVLLVDPLAGLMGYVGAHAVEYFVVVRQSLGRRYGTEPVGAEAPAAGGAPVRRPVPLARAVRSPLGRDGFLAVYVAVIVGIVMVLERLGSPTAYAVVFFTLGGLHVFYDGFIWKLRRAPVAASLAIPTS
ncbi:MAG: hypothetical protein U0Q07_07290 [Acidimicrobiales bacterium]